jgi:hypothetical protein
MRDELSLVLIAAAIPTGVVGGVGLHWRAAIPQQNHPARTASKKCGIECINSSRGRNLPFDLTGENLLVPAASDLS